MIWNWFKQQAIVEIPPKTIVYDCEIARCIPKKAKEPHLDYCQGWKDFAGMGISVICSYSYWNEQYHVYLEDNFQDFQELVNHSEKIIGFNSIAFDDQLCAANGLNIKTTNDLLCEIRIAAGMPPHYVKGITRSGYSLEALAQANLGYGKSSSGEKAPQLWQEGKRGQVINYCLQDVAITRQLWERKYCLVDPTTSRHLNLMVI